ncbi:fimbrial protein [Serratia fonticola]|uniref:fimbrial protein n=1 Tax=Serratia fonticola TaxID=47917 RepID=UPI001AEB097B|nr:fimbrial protein [Serratia fonticola]MBP1020186.1 fimbrial protein [Serratia fonticola]
MFFSDRKLIVSLVFLGALLCKPAFSNMLVYPMETSVGRSGSTQIKIASQSDDVLFVKVLVKRIVDPGTQSEKEVIADMNASDALIVTPQKLAITAGNERIVRLITLSLPEKETAWRVYFEAVSENEFNDMPSVEKNAGRTADVGVNIVWGALVHVPPEHEGVSVMFNPETKALLNAGTLRVPLREVATCVSESHCRWTKETATLYPGAELTLKSLSVVPGATYRIRYNNWLSDRIEEIKTPSIAQ